MSFIRGCGYFIDGLQLMLQPGLRRFVAVPVLINILLFSVLFFVIKHYVGMFDEWLSGQLPAWLQWLTALIWLFFLFSFSLMMVYLFVALANLLGAPFNSLLSEKVEIFLSHVPLDQKSMLEQIKDVPRSMGRQVGVIFYYVPRAIVILFLFLIPVVQLIAPFVWLLFNAWTLVLTYVDYPSENHDVPMKEVRRWMGERRMLALGFGLCVLLVSMIPVINLFAIPAAVAGATKLWVTERA